MAKKKQKTSSLGLIAAFLITGFFVTQVLTQEDSAATPEATEVAQAELPVEAPTVEAETPAEDSDTVVIAGHTVKVAEWIEDRENMPYQREAQFGKGWWDEDGNGCDTRNDLLTEAGMMGNGTIMYGDDKLCKVDSAPIFDQYTGEVIPFQFGMETSALVQIDHIIPLKIVWYAIAHQWTQEQRLSFSQDVRNLVASDGALNNWKDAKDAHQVIQSGRFSQEGTCFYIDRYTEVAEAYSIPVAPAAAEAMSSYWAGSCNA